MPPKRLVFAAKNPCNQFLILYLIKTRHKNCSSSKDFKFFLYNKVIDSIRKYPLPLICEQQLRMLAGVGDFLIGKLLEAIKQHYRKFMTDNGVKKQGQKFNNQSESISDASYSKQDFSNNMIFKADKRCYSQPMGWGSHSQYEEHSIQEERDFCPMPSNFQSIQKSVKSQCLLSSHKDKKYRPRPNTQAAYILQAMNKLSAIKTSVTKKDINKILEEQGHQKIKQWKSIRETLLKNNCIQLDPSVDYEAIFLTAKGETLSVENISKSVLKQTKTKIKQEISSLKQKKQFQQLEQKQEISQSMSQQHILSSKVKIQHQNQKGELYLVIDNRQIKNKDEDKNYFEEKMTSKYGIKCIKANISVGDFLWVYSTNEIGDQRVLDYIIQRKKADDLASSIIDGRYKQQKYRLKVSGVTNIIYLYEGHPSQSSQKTQKQLENALMKTRTMEGFKICKTKSIQETAKVLSIYHNLLLKKLEKGQLETVCTLADFNKLNSRNRNLTVQNLFGMSLKSFPNVGKQTVNLILRYFKSFAEFHQKLNQFPTNEERIQFLGGLLKGGRTQMASIKLIVTFFFQQ